ncbi:MAG: septum formation initiator family protein [Butyrivibrio sp.]|jgi:cell division protein FtsB|uniref:FtsB family cell division protein n=1 Tax=Butyrivibrio sp. TaxID=28121 RepID=UPI001B418C0D|nr:septum formation initiator family protein [Butyrivibrio sp.]MBE5823151.1 septum formation initiator family protein [Butyrivibrio sp.]MBE5828701.1 septum formation initiator family protein [Butyrivibrio sp.]MBP3275088.1 septum formation initiator family protein [Butyrivibrio sp.]MBP3277975.1 septum formation initiator family protein [Butyrivibrio sp.]MBP3783624.1 septum formation initiator family protein [Butyrivibrio sp.]
MATRARYKRRRFQNRAGIVWASIVVLILVTVVSIKSIGLLQKAREYQAREQALEEQIEYETQRSDEIAEYERYTETRKYIEDTAKEKLGLVYPGEIIFKNSDN